MNWARRLGGWIASFYTKDEIPWCALFVNGVLDECGIKGTNSLAARSFENWGRMLRTPAVGAVLVFTRKGGGHVGFYVGERDDAYRVLGGNQSDAVTETWIDKGRLLAGGIRWPYRFADGTPIPLPAEPRRVLLDDDGAPVSSRES